ncbi:MAG: peptide ABC transporter substrate-binding protein [Chloroflexi bacterium]|nr:MAG: peptide ABC transporter substrate-binding protein [Chloroflexota bacterium]
MTEHPSKFELLQAEVLAGKLSRRAVLKRATALGLSAPIIAGLLAACGGDDDDTSPTATSAPPPAATATTPPAAEPTATTAPAPEPTATTGGGSTAPTATTAPAPEPTATTPAEPEGPGRGLGDLLRILYWQAPTILNPHFAQGDKDSSASSLVLEPLLGLDPTGTLFPVLAAEVPSLENGGVSPDGTSVTYKLKQGVTWSDGEPFTAADVEFTWKWVTNVDASAVTIASYQVIESLEVVDDYTVTLKFASANPAWFTPFTGGYGGQIVPKHILENFQGAKARDAEFNLKPIGTGPFKVVEFKPGDVVTYELNENFRDPSRPFFKRVEFKGGGDATSAARAGIQTGETDWAWNLQVEKAVLEQIAAEGEFGELSILPGNSVERILVNRADPNTEVDGARSEPSTQHPYLSDLKVRQAFAMATDRETIATQLYGPAGIATTNLLVSPTVFASPNTTHTFDTDAAAALLDEAGWVLDGNTRKKDGVEMKALYQTTINPVRQKTQEIIKAAWEKIGVPTELKSIDAGVFFSSDAGNPDTAAHFYADFEMFTNGPANPYPIDYMLSWRSSDPAVDLAQKANDWSGSNYCRYVNEEYNKLWEQARTELDTAKQAELFIGMNDIVVNDVAEIPLVHRAGVTGVNKKLKGHNRSPWEPDTYDVRNWYMES